MKFLVLALCVCAASAASYGYKPWQPVQQAGQAFAKATVTVPEQAYKTFEQAAVKNAATPVTTVYNTPVAVAKSAVYNAPIAVAKTANIYADKEASAGILRLESDVTADGFNYGYETQNGIAAQSSGIQKTVGDTKVLAIQGSYQYAAPDGTPVVVSYIADENGYQPKSDLLPVGPAIPEAILRSLEYIQAHPQKFEKN